jgi:hypothetical protein
MGRRPLSRSSKGVGGRDGANISAMDGPVKKRDRRTRVPYRVNRAKMRSRAFLARGLSAKERPALREAGLNAKRDPLGAGSGLAISIIRLSVPTERVVEIIEQLSKSA